MTYDKKKKFIVDFIFFLIIAAIVIFVCHYLLGWITPFVIAFVVASVVNPVSDRLSRYFKAKKRLTALFCTFMFYTLGVALLFLIGFGIATALKDWLVDLPSIYTSNIEPAFANIFSWLNGIFNSLNPDIAGAIEEYASQFFANFGSLISEISVGAIGYLSSYVTKIPMFVVATLISVIASFFISLDYENIVAFIMRQLPKKALGFVKDIKEYGLSGLAKYGKSYLLIMTITFCELSLGLWLLGVENFFIIALVTAVFDIIPVCGSGGVLIPWSIFSLVQGDYAFGVAMLILYAIITVIRQIIEPKIIGDQVGLPPIVTLMSMFLGVRFMGVLGLFAFPLTLVVLKQLNDNGKISLFK